LTWLSDSIESRVLSNLTKPTSLGPKNSAHRIPAFPNSKRNISTRGFWEVRKTWRTQYSVGRSAEPRDPNVQGPSGVRTSGCHRPWVIQTNFLLQVIMYIVRQWYGWLWNTATTIRVRLSNVVQIGVAQCRSHSFHIPFYIPYDQLLVGTNDLKAAVAWRTKRREHHLRTNSYKIKGNWSLSLTKFQEKLKWPSQAEIILQANWPLKLLIRNFAKWKLPGGSRPRCREDSGDLAPLRVIVATALGAMTRANQQR
jgi:hypothetical protein